MKKYYRYIFVAGLFFLVVFACNKKDTKNTKNDTIIEGTASILVDETLLPIVEDQAIVFESQYKAKLNLLAKSEKESINDLVNKKASIIVLSRKLRKNEIAAFSKDKIKPKTTPFAIDAIALIKSKKSNDSLIVLKDVKDFLKGSKNSIKGLVFDNPNSSTVRQLCELAQIDSLPSQGIYSFGSNQQVVKHIAENDGMIGIIGLNWLTQPKPGMKDDVKKVNILSVKGESGTYIYPSQSSVGSREYPLARVLYIINCQGYDGLGMGFASFVAGEIGQRIIVQSDLAPIREPGHDIRVRNQIEKRNK